MPPASQLGLVSGRLTFGDISAGPLNGSILLLAVVDRHAAFGRMEAASKEAQQEFVGELPRDSR